MSGFIFCVKFKNTLCALSIMALAMMMDSTFAAAQTRLPAIVGSNMILQRNQPVPVWGWAAPGEKIVVEFSGQAIKAVAGKDSLWRVNLSPLEASTVAKIMTITAGTAKQTLKNILVGEVWLCSGQSNMEYPMDKGEFNAAGPKIGADSAALSLLTGHAGIRVVKIETKYSLPDATTTGWHECDGKNFARSSAVAFYFARQLQEKLHVPVGVITSAWSGSRIEPWAPREAFAKLPVFSGELTEQDSTLDGEVLGKMYRSLIAPLIPFGIKGFIWYQGESNCLAEEHDMRYAYKMQATIAYWRKQWGAELPFYYVLIAPHMYSLWTNKPHTVETLPAFWEQQVAASAIPNTGFIATTDLVDDLKDIHPSYKWTVGRRLADLALAKAYQVKHLAYQYPVYDHQKIIKDKIVVYLKNAKGLKTRDGRPPDEFTIAGRDNDFKPAVAIINGETITVYSPEVKDPVNVRFGWKETAMPNLINGHGLPAVPFRSNGIPFIYRSIL
ncbi:MAG: sialate O-acetylesterase [Mucilaginibacter sp.]|nr:sialate O-acetylesterase [Mucilaginibacter sp.]